MARVGVTNMESCIRGVTPPQSSHQASFMPPRRKLTSKEAMASRHAEFIEYLFWVMEQTDLPEATVRRRWWAVTPRD